MKPRRRLFDLYLAQLNYSVVWHLFVAYTLRHAPTEPAREFERFTHCVIRLCSAVDVADELLQRHDKTYTGTDPWKDAQPSRRAWRASNRDRYRRNLQDYRNQLVHSGAVGSLRDGQTTLVPRVGHHRRYRDWRKLYRVSEAAQRRDFRPTQYVMDEAWLKTLRYLERWWRWMLRRRGVRMRLAPMPLPAAVSRVIAHSGIVTSSASEPPPLPPDFWTTPVAPPRRDPGSAQESHESP
jgi:hypothetical protein